jgi:hypothetical protein
MRLGMLKFDASIEWNVPAALPLAGEKRVRDSAEKLNKRRGVVGMKSMPRN